MSDCKPGMKFKQYATEDCTGELVVEIKFSEEVIEKQLDQCELVPGEDAVWRQAKCSSKGFALTYSPDEECSTEEKVRGLDTEFFGWGECYQMGESSVKFEQE